MNKICMKVLFSIAALLIQKYVKHFPQVAYDMLCLLHSYLALHTICTASNEDVYNKLYKP